jgi:glucose-6-phosphate dehydrogenase assembly protein OpcA
MQKQESIVPNPNIAGIDVDRIEQELTRLWRRTAAQGDEEAAGITRACTLNLIVYSCEREDQNAVSALLDEVIQQHPGRIFLLITERESPQAALDASVSSHCRSLSGTKKEICSEQITIVAKADAVHTAGTAVEPLLVPDVPVFLWWKDVPDYRDKLWQRLVRMSDRVVVDSACFDKPFEDIHALSMLLDQRPEPIRISDLNWGRLTTWRSLIASFWDVPAYREALRSIDQVTIEYCRQELTPGEVPPKPFLLAGWLASRLGWRLETGKAFERSLDFKFQGPDRMIEVRIAESNVGHLDRDLLNSVTICSSQSAACFNVAFSHDRHRLTTEARVADQSSAGRTIAYEARSEGARLSNELSFISRDRVYEGSLAVAAAMVAAVARKEVN